MYYDDHNPPHFREIYAGAEAEFGITPLAVLRGRFPRRALGMVLCGLAVEIVLEAIYELMPSTIGASWVQERTSVDNW